MQRVPRSIQIDWYVVHVKNVRRLYAIIATGVVAAGLLFFAYQRMNLPPEARARRAIERAELAKSQAEEQVLPQNLKRELSQASVQLDEARNNYLNDRFQEAEAGAESARLRFLALAGSGTHQLTGVGEFFSLEGRVQLQRAGQSEWENAQQRVPVFNGDFVRSGRDGSAEILFTDGSLYRIAPNSLLEIHHESESDKPTSTVKMRLGRISVVTSSASSTVTTDTTETEISGDSRVAVDVAGGDQGTRVATFEGAARVRSTTGSEIVLASRQQVETDSSGELSEPRSIPDPPVLLEPQNNAGFDMKKHTLITLEWRGRSKDQSVHLQISRSRRFNEDILEVDGPDIRKDTARLRVVAPGTYFWRAAIVGANGVKSEWSQVRRLRIYSSLQRALLADRTAPKLSLLPTQQLGAMFIVQGRTEAGATVIVNEERIITDADGHFRMTVEILNEGWNDLEVIVRDPSGNETRRRERVFVEVY
jgi:hypothetical protein